jgi:hypothetical protein
MALDHPDIQIDFFGAPQPVLRRSALTIQNGTATPTTENLRRRFALSSKSSGDINIAQYDGFCWYGLGYGLVKLFRFNETYRMVGNYGTSDYDALLSAACFEEVARTWVRNSVEFGWIRQFRDHTGQPMLLYAQPLPSDAIRTSGDNPYWGELPVYGPALTAILHREIDPFAENFSVELLSQPQETISDDYYTFGSFQAENFFHMNTAYGEAAMKAILPRMKEGDPRRKRRAREPAQAASGGRSPLVQPSAAATR